MIMSRNQTGDRVWSRKVGSAYRHEIGRLLSDREGNDSRVRVRDGDFHRLAGSSALSVAGKVYLQVVPPCEVE